MKIIGIGGTDASGKDTLGNLLADDYGYFFISVTDILRDEARRRNRPLGRQILREISAEWRRKYGLGVLVDKAMVAYEREARTKRFGGLALASLRNPGEADRVHELGGKVVWTDADPKLRYQRVLKRQRGTEDKVTFDQFIAEEQAQFEHQGDEATLSLNGVKARADIFISNHSNSLEDFKRTIGEALGGLL